MRWASDDALVQFVTASVDLLEQLQGISPDIYWDYMTAPTVAHVLIRSTMTIAQGSTSTHSSRLKPKRPWNAADTWPNISMASISKRVRIDLGRLLFRYKTQAWLCRASRG
jgi:hypothetical protein